MNAENRNSRRFFLATVASAGAVFACGTKTVEAGGPDNWEREEAGRREAPYQQRTFDPPEVEKPVEAEKPRIFTQKEVEVILEEEARKAGLDPEKVKRVAWCESRFDPYAQNRSGATGVLQITPTTWQNILNKFLPFKRENMNIWDAKDNIEAGVTLWKLDGSQHWRECGG